MRKFILCLTLLTSFNLYAEKKGDGEWKKTTLSDSAIEQIQAAKYKYNQCISVEIEKMIPANLDSRKATDIVLKKCESVLTEVRNVFIGAEVTEKLADRYMKKTRTETARNTLKHLMFVDAAKKMGQPTQ